MIILLVICSVFFVAFTSGGHRVEVLYPYNMIFNQNNFYLLLGGLFACSIFLLLKKKWDERHVMFIALYYVCSAYILTRAIISTNHAFIYPAITLLISPLIINLKEQQIVSFYKVTITVLVAILVSKMSDVAFGTQFSIVQDIRYFNVAEDGTLRLSNSLSFGNRNLAGGFVAGLFLLSFYVSQVTRDNLRIFDLGLLICTLSTFSATAILTMFAVFALRMRWSLWRLLAVFIFILAFSDQIFRQLPRKLSSGAKKIETVIDFFATQTYEIYILGNIHNEARPWIESAILDVVYDIGVFPIAVFILGTLIYLGYNCRLKQYVPLGIFVLIFAFSNSTISLPVIILFLLCLQLAEKTVVIK